MRLGFVNFLIAAECTGILNIPRDKNLQVEAGRTWGLYLENYVFANIYRNEGFPGFGGGGGTDS